MGQISANVIDEFKWIATGLYESFRDQLLIPSKPKTFEEQIRHKFRGLYSSIRIKDDTISYQQGKLQEKEYESREQRQLLSRKEKELSDLKVYVRSLERQLQEERARNRRRR